LRTKSTQSGIVKIYINALDGETKGDLRPHYWRETFPQMECGLKGDI
jgi:hypothetical protein